MELFASVTHCTDEDGTILKNGDAAGALNKPGIFKNDEMTEQVMDQII